MQFLIFNSSFFARIINDIPFSKFFPKFLFDKSCNTSFILFTIACPIKNILLFFSLILGK